MLRCSTRKRRKRGSLLPRKDDIIGILSNRKARFALIFGVSKIIANVFAVVSRAAAQTGGNKESQEIARYQTFSDTHDLNTTRHRRTVNRRKDLFNLTR